MRDDADRWVVAADCIFMLPIAPRRGLEHATIVANGEHEPDTMAIVRQFVETGAADDLPTSADAFFAPWWATIRSAGKRRPSNGR
ncbi:MAG: hypothetical protein LC797_15005 [Chloroflexi bacterium]|nr:hypothetical protein [Chloroflexota bacterium]